jgi:hypothetical protein
MTSDERAAMRAYLQRSEVRLSTIHRTVTALLSGAGVLVLLPAIGRDSVVNVLRSLLSTTTPMHWALAVLVVATLGLTFAVLWLLLYEITRFYFHSNHVTSERGATFTPRFTITSLHLPSDELSEGAASALQERRDDPANVELLVPSNDTARRHIDGQIRAYDGLTAVDPPTDASRAEALLQLAGVRDRLLVDEVAKIEYGMARHVLRVQVIVLRYIKALLVVITTLAAVYAMAAVVEDQPTVPDSAARWIVATLVLWAPAVLFVSASPVHWLDQLLRSEGATSAGIRYDRDLTRLERVVAAVSVGVLAGALGCGAVLLGREASTAGNTGLAIAGAIGIAAEAWLLRRVRR